MNFQKPESVLAVIRLGEQVETNRAYNRTKVLDAANGKPPLTPDEAEKDGVSVNVNFLELLVLLWHARSQLESAFLRNQYFFTVKIPSAPVDYRAGWESSITTEINRVLTKSREYFELHRSRWASVVTHGVGPMGWFHPEKWLPRYISISDLRIPTDTTTDFKNLTWYAVRIPYTPLELVEEAFSKKANNHWNKEAVFQILKNYKDTNSTDAMNNYDWNLQPEKIAELIKQNGALWGSDAVPVIPLYHFYHQQEDDKGEIGWHMKIVPTAVVRGSNEQEFLWKSKKPVAPKWTELLHCQFGDLSTDAPFKYHSIRGLGFLLLEPCFFSNITRCKFIQYVHEAMEQWLRVSDNPDKARAQVQEFGNNKVLSHGVEVVPNDQRHTVDTRNVDSVMAQMKQLMGEASASFTQAIDNGTAKEQTAFEVRVKMEQVNAMMSGILLTAFKFESYADQEICRRFCIDNSSDQDVQKFRKRMRKAGVPDEFIDIDLWDVEPVTPLGSGNPTIALSMAQQLMEIRPLLNDAGQAQVLHDYILTVTKDASKANLLAPLDNKMTNTDATRESAGLFSTLMLGLPVKLWDSHLLDQINILMPLMAGMIDQFEKRDNMANAQDGLGLMTVENYINQAIEKLAQDPKQKPAVKQFSDTMGKLGNQIKALIQRGSEAAKAQQQSADQAELQMKIQEAQLKMQTMQQTTQHKIQSDQVKTAQDIALKEKEFNAEQQRANEAHLSELRRQNIEAAATISRDDAKTNADIHNSKEKAAADAENARLKSQAAKTNKGEE